MSEVRSQKYKTCTILFLLLISYFRLLTPDFFLLTSDLCWAMPWSKDMFDQPTGKPQKDLPPPAPEGIVSTAGKLKEIKNRGGAAGLLNQIKPTVQSIERGRHFFNIYCTPCHGAGGKGDGTVGKKFVPPTDLTSEYVQKKPDGDIFYTITYGGLAVMPGYGDAIPPEDRWHLINYIKNVIGKKR